MATRDRVNGGTCIASRFCKALVLSYAMLVLVTFGRPAPAEALLTSTLVDTPNSPVYGFWGGGQYDFASISMFLDPALTNWVAWADHVAPYSCSSGTCIGAHGFGTNDYIRLKVTPPVGSALELTMDWNSEYAISSGPQMVIFGTAAVAPDVRRMNGFGGSPTFVYFNEAGAFNSLFTSAGTYKFDFSFRDQHCCDGGHGDVYLLADTTPVPEPATLLLLGSGLAGMGWFGRKRLKNDDDKA